MGRWEPWLFQEPLHIHSVLESEDIWGDLVIKQDFGDMRLTLPE